MTRRGMTLVEMLVAMTATLLIMAAVAQAFSAFGDAVSGGRSVLELDARMRTVAWRLRSDLAGGTARPVPPLNPAAGEGYLEIIEGPATDYGDSSLISTAGSAVSGDHDDALLLTTRSLDTPFIGRAPGTGGSTDDTFESTLAEVGWFARPTPGTSNPATFTLFRKQLLVMGYVGTDPFLAGNNSLAWSGSWAGYFNAPCDVSVRREGNVLYPNTLAELTRREARFLHNPLGLTGTAAFPAVFAAGNHQSNPAPDGLIFETVQRQGEDVVLTNVVAFDVRVFDPAAPVFRTADGSALVPGDPGFENTAFASGAYVDLGHAVTANSLLSPILPRFAGFGLARSGLAGSAATPRTYDTWSLGYEADGLDQDNDGTSDDGTNGLDDDGDGSFDEPPYDADGDGVFEDAGESETLPPYPHPLRGIEIRIRCYEPSSRQVRQVTVRHTFVPH
jgi:prepilin-type N-terminal cleavage/methylation domain-containing protein